MKLKIFLKLAQARTSTAFTVRVSETDGESQPISGAGQMRTDQCEGIICLRKPCSLLSFRLDHRYTRTACHYNNLLLTCAEQDSLNAHLPLPPTGWVRHAPFASTLVSGNADQALSEATVLISGQGVDNSYVALGRVTLKCHQQDPFGEESKPVDLHSSEWLIASRQHSYHRLSQLRTNTVYSGFPCLPAAAAAAPHSGCPESPSASAGTSAVDVTPCTGTQAADTPTVQRRHQHSGFGQDELVIR